MTYPSASANVGSHVPPCKIWRNVDEILMRERERERSDANLERPSLPLAQTDRRCYQRTGMGKFLLKSNQVPILRNFLVVKFHLKRNLVPHMRNFSPTLPSFGKHAWIWASGDATRIQSARQCQADGQTRVIPTAAANRDRRRNFCRRKCAKDRETGRPGCMLGDGEQRVSSRAVQIP